jgi:adenylate cyclase
MSSRPLSKSKFFATKNFAFIIALIVFLLSILAMNINEINYFIEILQLNVNDQHFILRNRRNQVELSEGVTFIERDLNISPDILILGVDNPTLDLFGSWPFPRHHHADLLNTLYRIQDQTTRESVVFLDFLFNEIDAADPVGDALLSQSMRSNGRVIVETTFESDPEELDELQQEYVERHDYLLDNFGEIANITGDWFDTLLYLGKDPPVPGIIEGAAGYGFATVSIDDESTIRWVPLLQRSTKFIAEYPLDFFEQNFDSLFQYDGSFLRLQWIDARNSNFPVSVPIFDEDGTFLLDEAEVAEITSSIRRRAVPRLMDGDGDGTAEEEQFFISLYIDRFMPSVVLSIVAEYFNLDFTEVKVVLGENIILPNPRVYNSETRSLDRYRIQTALQQVDPETGEILQEAEYRDIENITIPIDELGRMKVNFRGERSDLSRGTQTYPVRSYSAYARRATGPISSTWPQTLALDNKIVLAGFMAPGLDEKATPMGTMFGIELFANAINTIIMDNFLIDWPMSTQLIFTAALLFVIALLTSRTNNFVALFIVLIMILGVFIFADIMFNSRNILVPSVHPVIAMIFTFLSVVIYRGLTEEREKRRVQGMFGQYVSPEVVEQIVQADNPPELGGVDKELTVFFSDIRGFTTLSEKMAPQELVNHLNVYLSSMTDIIMEYKGTLDKYVGDEIMCFWGAPLDQRNHAILACQCAIKQMQKLRELNEGWARDLRIDIGIGINSGIMTVGNMGSSGRMNYTLMGDNVNLGARLEGINKQYFGQEWIEQGQKHIGTGSKIIISEYTYGLVKDKVIARELDNIRVKGKNRPVVIYELIDVLVGLDPYLDIAE